LRSCAVVKLNANLVVTAQLLHKADCSLTLHPHLAAND
jgi:hypothetical protein